MGGKCEEVCGCGGAEKGKWGVEESLPELDFSRSVGAAALSGDLPRMRHLLLKNGSHARSQDRSGYTPLHYAARSGHLDACRLLLQHGAQVNECTKATQSTALHRAAYAGHIEVVKLLLESGANVDACDCDGCTALDKAVAQGRWEVVKILSSASNSSNLET